MKKHLPSLDEVISFTVLFVVASLVWQFVGAPLLNAVNSVKSKVS